VLPPCRQSFREKMRNAMAVYPPVGFSVIGKPNTTQLARQQAFTNESALFKNAL
jgi:hypothetical protein